MNDRSHIAELLLEARGQRGLSLELAASQSGVPLRYVQLLEGETPTIGIPDEFYLIPFFRTYARFLGLEVEKLLPEFLGQVQRVPTKPTAPIPIALGRPSALSIDRLWKPTAGVLAVVLAAFLMTRNSPEPVAAVVAAGNAAEVPKSVDTFAAAAREPLLQAGAPQVADAVRVLAPPASVPPAARRIVDERAAAGAASDPAPVGARELHILATETVWLEIGRDDGPLQEFWLEPGDTHTWTANDSFTLKLGNAGGVALAFDGRVLPPLGKSGQVVRVRLPHPTAHASGG